MRFYDLDLLSKIGILGGWIAFILFIEFSIAWLWIRFLL
jgi:hypothetical protein